MWRHHLDPPDFGLSPHAFQRAGQCRFILIDEQRERSRAIACVEGRSGADLAAEARRGVPGRQTRDGNARKAEAGWAVEPAIHLRESAIVVECFAESPDEGSPQSEGLAAAARTPSGEFHNDFVEADRHDDEPRPIEKEPARQLGSAFGLPDVVSLLRRRAQRQADQCPEPLAEPIDVREQPRLAGQCRHIQPDLEQHRRMPSV